MGRMVMGSGQAIDRATARNSTYERSPDLDALDFNGPSYIMPDENGCYETYSSGITKRF
ncbi:MAG: hypothetical protein IJD43_14765 [Thermoguttaceae bacterium]|nr:hypothetical protein [Thermoguttaceae bacterium]